MAICTPASLLHTIVGDELRRGRLHSSRAASRPTAVW
jgi:hypothetical protein